MLFEEEKYLINFLSHILKTFTYLFQEFFSCKYVDLILPINVIQVRTDQRLVVNKMFYEVPGLGSKKHKVAIGLCAEVQLWLNLQKNKVLCLLVRSTSWDI